MVTMAGDDPKGLRDRAILLLGFAGAFRRSERVALDITDLEFCNGGLRVRIRKSKTDQEGLGATIASCDRSYRVLCLNGLNGIGDGRKIGWRLNGISRDHTRDRGRRPLIPTVCH
jgi:integrase